MRVAVWLALTCIGLLLLFFARNRYQAANIQLSRLNSVEAVVSAVGADGALHLRYTVAAEAYEIDRDVPVNIPKIHIGDKVTLLYQASRPDAARLRQWSVVYQDAAVIGGFGAAAILIAMVVFVMMGTPPTIAPSPQIYAGIATLDHAIELKNTRREFVVELAIPCGIFVAAILLWRNPYFLWWPWLSYSGAVAIAILGLFMVWNAFDTKAIRIRADQEGVAIKDPAGDRKFPWGEVTLLKHRTMTEVRRHRHAIRNNRESDYWYTTDEIGHWLILLDAGGKELLKLDEDTPMEPLQDWLRLRAFIPGRTGLTPQEEITQSPLGQRDAF
jgi:hypothetical protein